MTAIINLPEWAVFKLDKKGNPIMNGLSHVIDILTHVAYPAILREYKALYDAVIPGEFKGSDGKLKKEWADCLGNLDPENPSSYWIAVVRETAKLDVQIATHTFGLNLKMVDPEKKYREGDLVQGRDPLHAVGGGVGVKGKRAPGREARDHYKRLRGVFPA